MNPFTSCLSFDSAEDVSSYAVHLFSHILILISLDPGKLQFFFSMSIYDYNILVKI